MKKQYCAPKAKKIDYSFNEQVAAASYPINNYADPWRGGVCTWDDGGCSWVFNQMARGLDDCEKQGNPELLNPYADCY